MATTKKKPASETKQKKVKGFLEVHNDNGDECLIARDAVVMIRPLSQSEIAQWATCQSYVVLSLGEAGTALQESVADLIDLIEGED